MDRVKWRKPINCLMVLFIVFCILSYIPGLSNPIKLFLLIPALVSLGYFIEYGFPHSLQPPLVRLQSLLYPGFVIIFILFTGAWENKPFFEAISDPMFWIACSLTLILWMVGSTVYRYLHMGFTEESVD